MSHAHKASNRNVGIRVASYASPIVTTERVLSGNELCKIHRISLQRGDLGAEGVNLCLEFTLVRQVLALVFLPSLNLPGLCLQGV